MVAGHQQGTTARRRPVDDYDGDQLVAPGAIVVGARPLQVAKLLASRAPLERDGARHTTSVLALPSAALRRGGDSGGGRPRWHDRELACDQAQPARHGGGGHRLAHAPEPRKVTPFRWPLLGSYTVDRRSKSGPPQPVGV